METGMKMMRIFQIHLWHLSRRTQRSKFYDDVAVSLPKRDNANCFFQEKKNYNENKMHVDNSAREKKISLFFEKDENVTRLLPD